MKTRPNWRRTRRRCSGACARAGRGSRAPRGRRGRSRRPPEAARSRTRTSCARSSRQQPRAAARKEHATRRSSYSSGPRPLPHLRAPLVRPRAISPCWPMTLSTGRSSALASAGQERLVVLAPHEPAPATAARGGGALELSVRLGRQLGLLGDLERRGPRPARGARRSRRRAALATLHLEPAADARGDERGHDRPRVPAAAEPGRGRRRSTARRRGRATRRRGRASSASTPPSRPGSPSREARRPRRDGCLARSIRSARRGRRT